MYTYLKMIIKNNNNTQFNTDVVIFIGCRPNEYLFV